MRYLARSARAHLLPAPPKPLLVCFSHLRWSFVWQRPQHLLSRAAREYRVLFVEEPVYAQVTGPSLDLSAGPGAITIVAPILPEHMKGSAGPAAHQSLLDALIEDMAAPEMVSWYYTPMALEYSHHVEANVCVYDCMDELSAFRGASPDMRQREQQLFRSAHVVFTGGQSLYEAKRSRHPNVHCFPSSIDVPHFKQARHITADPTDQAAIPRPRIGFFGVLDERLDTDLVAALADANPQWQLVMIGPLAKIEAADLPRRPNIHWLGGKSYEELPAYMSGWEAGFMPFALNEATRFISPTKTPEFLAAGLPVASTPVRDVVKMYGEGGYVEIADGAPHMSEKLQILLQRPREHWLERVDLLLATMSWDSTWEAMSQEINKLRTQRTRPTARPHPAEDVEAAVAGKLSRV